MHRWETGQAKPRLPELEATLHALNASEAERSHAFALIDAPRARAKPGSAVFVDISLPHRGDLMRSLRLRRGWTQSVAAANLGVRQPTLAHWEAMDTIPSGEALARFCVLLNAYPEEREALQSPHLIPATWPKEPDIDACAAQVAAYERSVQALDSPLADLYALALKRQLLRLLRESPSPASVGEAIRLLSVTNTSHSWYLQMQQRHAEAKKATWAALDLAERTRRPEPHWAEALNVASLYAAHKSPDKRAHINLYLRWLPIFPVCSPRMRIECDIAYYASLIPGNGAEARHRLAVAEATLQSCVPADEADEDYFRLTYCRALARIGQPLEAARDFPAVRTLTADNAMRLIQWAEVMVMAGEKNEAARLVADIKTILAQVSLPTIRVLTDKVGHQL